MKTIKDTLIKIADTLDQKKCYQEANLADEIVKDIAMLEAKADCGECVHPESECKCPEGECECVDDECGCMEYTEDDMDAMEDIEKEEMMEKESMDEPEMDEECADLDTAELDAEIDKLLFDPQSFVEEEHCQLTQASTRREKRQILMKRAARRQDVLKQYK